MIIDGAGWYESKDLIVTKNIQIIILPPYCPELKLVKRLRKYIKNNTIRNKVFETLKDLEKKFVYLKERVRIQRGLAKNSNKKSAGFLLGSYVKKRMGKFWIRKFFFSNPFRLLFL